MIINKIPGEINKHMQDLSAEFEDLFDPYLPVASKLKIKSCPGNGVSAEGNTMRNALEKFFSLFVSRPLR